MRTSSRGSLVLWFAVGAILLWWFLPQILLQFLPKGAVIETTDGQKIGG